MRLAKQKQLFLARELNADLLIMDERIPRIIAKSLGLKVVEDWRF